MTAVPSLQGVILLGHGSRDPLWHRPMQAVAARLAELAPHTPVRCAYLELSTPALAEAASQLLDGGVRHISVVPLFLGVGKHAREDLPRLVDALRAQHPDAHIALQEAVGESPRLVQLLAEIALEGLKP